MKICITSEQSENCKNRSIETISKITGTVFLAHCVVVMVVRARCGCEGCGGSLNEINGTFASPNYPGSVTAAFTCSWAVHVPARRSVNLLLSISPTLPPASGSSGGGGGAPDADAGCGSSYVRVEVFQSGGQSTALGTYCVAVSTTKTVESIHRVAKSSPLLFLLQLQTSSHNFSLLNSEINCGGSVIKTTTSPQICCRTTLRKVSVQR